MIVESYAQAGQDAWVMHHHPTPGYFVDVGAHDGVTHSNTYALEQRGWKGLCVEPNREASRLLRGARSCALRQVVASNHCQEVPFDGVRVGSGVPVHCEPLWQILGSIGAPPVIDYLSIDVEGHELEVLAGMDFDRWQVGLITIEHNLYSDGPARKDAIFDYLTERGFERVREDVVAEGYGPYEDWYGRA